MSKLKFNNHLDILLFACYAKKPFTVKDVIEFVVDGHRSTIYSALNQFVEMGCLERCYTSHYKATEYAKDIMNVKVELVA